jgi:hypothetical protein
VSKEPTELEKLRAQLEAKRNANKAFEDAAAEANEVEETKRAIAIEDKRAECYAAGLLPEQLGEAEFPAIGRVLFRSPPELIYDKFAKKSGMLKAELKDDIAVYDEVAHACVLVPDGKEFLRLSRERNPHARVQMGSALLQRMRDRLAAEGK